MVICRNENLIKHAAEVALNNLTVRESEEGETVVSSLPPSPVVQSSISSFALLYFSAFLLLSFP